MSIIGHSIRTSLATLVALCAVFGLTGCRALNFDGASLESYSEMSQTTIAPARELEMVSLPPYRLAPSDLVRIEVPKQVPLPPYRAQVFDMVEVKALGVSAEQPIGVYIDEEGRPAPTPDGGVFQVQVGGFILLPFDYGMVQVEGLSIDEIRKAITKQLLIDYLYPDVSVKFLKYSGMQPVSREEPYLVAPDGTVNLGKYGCIRVAGLTVGEAQEAIQKCLAEYLNSPEVAVHVLQHTSNVYYIITEGAGLGDNLVTQPITGNETVLDAISAIGGLSQLSSKEIWIARPSSANACEQILPVRWDAIVRGGQTATNYQLMSGDRVFIKENATIAVTNFIGRITGPFERAAGITSLTTSTIRSLQTTGRGYNRNRR